MNSRIPLFLLIAAGLLVTTLVVLFAANKLNPTVANPEPAAQAPPTVPETRTDGDVEVVEEPPHQPKGDAFSYLALRRPGYSEMWNLVGEYPGIVDDHRRNPDRWLWQASKLGLSEAVDALINRGAKPRSDDLLVAVANGNVETTRVLLEHGVRHPRVMMASGHHETPDVAAALLGFEISVNARGDLVGSTALHSAASSGRYQTAAFLLEFAADPNIEDNMGMTPLDWALRKGHSDVARLLRSYNARRGSGDIKASD